MCLIIAVQTPELRSAQFIDEQKGPVFFWPGLTMFSILYQHSVSYRLVSHIKCLIIHLKKLLRSDWLKRSAFLVNTVQKSVTRVQITTKISEVKTKTARGQPMYFEDCQRSCETFQRFPKTVRNLPKITEDHTKPPVDFRRSPEHFRKFPKIVRTLPTISGDLRRSPDIFEAFPSFRRSKAIPSVYLSSKSLSCLFFQVYY